MDNFESLTTQQQQMLFTIKICEELPFSELDGRLLKSLQKKGFLTESVLNISLTEKGIEVVPQPPQSVIDHVLKEEEFRLKSTGKQIENLKKKEKSYQERVNRIQKLKNEIES